MTIKMHIIHLQERKDRAQLLNKELIKQNIINFKIWDGVLDKENPKRGIAKAHKQIVEWASSFGFLFSQLFVLFSTSVRADEFQIPVHR